MCHPVRVERDKECHRLKHGGHSVILGLEMELWNKNLSEAERMCSCESSYLLRCVHDSARGQGRGSGNIDGGVG